MDRRNIRYKKMTVVICLLVIVIIQLAAVQYTVVVHWKMSTKQTTTVETKEKINTESPKNATDKKESNANAPKPDYGSSSKNSTDKNASATMQNCGTLRETGLGGHSKSGVYLIKPGVGAPFNVFCDMMTCNGGWTMIQRRWDGSGNFFRNWTEYKNGFGNLASEHWLGNDKIHELTKRQDMMIRIDLEDSKGVKRFAEYTHFYIDDESKQYRLHIGSYSGTAGDSLGYHNGYGFSTRDRDNDITPGSCATHLQGAWWFGHCLQSHLNGKYLNGPSPWAMGIIWYTFRGNTNSLTMSEMKIRPRSYKL